VKHNEYEKAFIKAACVATLASSLSLLALAPAAAAPIDWSKVQGKDVTLFYPGQASWEWVLTASNHSGATNFREGKVCTACHEGEQAQMGALIVSGKKLEPNPIPGKRGSIPLNVKIAYDAERIYFRLSWPDANQPGLPVMDPKYAIKATVMLDDGSVLEAVRAGCWGACHDDANEMASSVSGQDLKKYLSKSRTKITRQGGGTNYKSDEEIAAIAAEGGYLEYLQARANPGQEPSAVHGHILKAREEDTSSPVSATASLKDGTWVVTLSRPLASSGPYAKAIVPGKSYPIGFAIHDDHASGRHHQVSFGYSFVLGQGEADFVAAKH
jgi:Ethylbenzene dehydrogenase